MRQKLDGWLDRGELRLLNKRIALAPLQVGTLSDLLYLLPFTKSLSFSSMLEKGNVASANNAMRLMGGLRDRIRGSLAGCAPDPDIVGEFARQFRDELGEYLGQGGNGDSPTESAAALKSMVPGSV